MRAGAPNNAEAVILAGGLGTRLRSVIGEVPKPLACVSRRPFLAWMLDSLAKQGFEHVILATGYRGEQIEATLGNSWCGMALQYSRESRPLGTGGAIALAARYTSGDAFFVVNGDTWLTLDYAAFEKQAEKSGARLGIALARVDDIGRYGAVCVDNKRIVDLAEKGGVGPGLINAGVYWLKRDLLSEFPGDEPFSFEARVLVPLIAREMVFAHTDTSNFIDIGVPEDYARAQYLIGPGSKASA